MSSTQSTECSICVFIVWYLTTVMAKFQVWDQLPNLKAVIQYIGELEDKSNPNVYTVNMRFYLACLKHFIKLKLYHHFV